MQWSKQLVHYKELHVQLEVGRSTGACHSYVYVCANIVSWYKLAVNQCAAAWFQLFDEREIQVLISGAEVAINVEDLTVNTH